MFWIQQNCPHLWHKSFRICNLPLLINLWIVCFSIKRNLSILRNPVAHSGFSSSSRDGVSEKLELDNEDMTCVTIFLCKSFFCVGRTRTNLFDWMSLVSTLYRTFDNRTGLHGPEEAFWSDWMMGFFGLKVLTIYL